MTEELKEGRMNRRPLKPEIASLVSLLTSITLDDYLAEIEADQSNDSTQVFDSADEGENRDPDSSSTIPAVNAAIPHKVRIDYGARNQGTDPFAQIRAAPARTGKS